MLADELSGRLKDRFLGKSLSSVIKEISLIHPANFKNINTNHSFPELCKLSGVKNKEKLKFELKNFIIFYSKLNLKRNNKEGDFLDTDDFESSEESSGEDEDEDDLIADDVQEEEIKFKDDFDQTVFMSCDGKCLNCLGCVVKILFKFNMHSKAYKRIFKIFKTILLPTQVECERSFSKLKKICVDHLLYCMAGGSKSSQSASA